MYSLEFTDIIRMQVGDFQVVIAQANALNTVIFVFDYNVASIFSSLHSIRESVTSSILKHMSSTIPRIAIKFQHPVDNSYL